MAVARLDNAKTTIDTGNDSIVIAEYLEGVPGGRTLDVTGFTSPVIQAGHIVIVETATKERKRPCRRDTPMRVLLRRLRSQKNLWWVLWYVVA